ncbi:MAG TPA: organoarsenical effux MFS transporter ArsJ [Geminicoccus sp.]|jgi:MFS family permease|uniref:organoarsenical effux MFS transporter ArsJ n=1 Tax=Geminicoccus sp. TaxID=2024832 RepID=UPI002E2F2840|nr:organoarsenical effux MFS transporter ArsJ [Geminicoccus sp.]HEX2528649.1 organoarsenical effux MFS transporter ArsJ [Geminicoccus sp.]
MNLRSYGIVTAAYWGETVTDGALHMLVLLHFYTLGFTPFQVATLFVLYEACGILTNLLGGWIAARFGLKLTLYSGLVLQIVSLLALSLLDPGWPAWLSVVYAVAVQGLAGIAKDLTKMSSKSAIKLVVPENAEGALFRWVAILTGSKNAMKGIGFFLGGLLLATLGFKGGLLLLAACLGCILALVLAALPAEMGRTKAKAPLKGLFSKSPEINLLSAARFFLFGARDIWFVVGIPVFLYDVAGWHYMQVATFLAAWVIGYGLVQAAAPGLVRRTATGLAAEVRAARLWALVLAVIPLALALVLAAALPWDVLVTAAKPQGPVPSVLDPGLLLVVGLGLFGVAFALNSSLHSFLILAYSTAERVTLDVGFYYMANAGGRLVGCLLSGLTYQAYGVIGCLGASTLFLVASWLIATFLPKDRASGQALAAAQR